jgi:hypothetical protein
VYVPVLVVAVSADVVAVSEDVVAGVDVAVAGVEVDAVLWDDVEAPPVVRSAVVSVDAARRVAAVEPWASSIAISKPAIDVMSTPRLALRSRLSAWSRLRCPSFMDISLRGGTKNRLIIG